MRIATKRAVPVCLAATTLLLIIGTTAVTAQVQLNIQPGAQLSWPTPNTTNTYHLQWAPISGGSWSDLVAAVTGSGTTRTNIDIVPSATRQYQDLEIVPGTAPTFPMPSNGGFENGTGSSATSWTVDTSAGGPVYAVRTNDSPNSGSYNFQVHLASTGAGPVVQFNQSAIPVVGGTSYPFSFYSKALSGSQGYSGQWRILWSPSGDTGYQNFTPGANTYSQFTTTVTPPAGATSGTIFIHIAGAAVTTWVANIDIDDVVLGSGGSTPGTPAVSNILQVATLPVAQVSWQSTLGVQYNPESTTNLTAGTWTNTFGTMVGNGGTMSILSPMTNSAMFFHLRIPPVSVLPPTNLHQVPSGSSNSVDIAWAASASIGVTNYRMFYGDVSGTTTNTVDLGNVSNTIISGLTSGVTYFVSIIAISPNGQSQASDATIQVQVSTNSGGVIWSDEFNGSVIDSATWTYDVSGAGFGNGQLEYDTARHENSYTTNGNLVIEARRENYLGNSFTSARMLTQGRFAYLYGDLEARIKLPNTANGLWPAFWMMGNNAGAIVWPACGEVDITEMGGAAGIAQGLQQRLIDSAVHYSNATNGYSNYVAWDTAPVDLTLDYHLYKVSWTPTAISFYLDGVAIGSMDITANYLTEFHQPMFPILNIAIGGYNPSYTGIYSPGAVTATLPARMYVDWIRLTDNGYTQLALGDNNAESGNFGVFTETTPVNHSLVYGTGSEPGFEYGTNAALYIWENMVPSLTPPTASEGTTCWSFNIVGGDWFGMGVFLPNFRNMQNYSDGYLHFDLRTSSTVAMQVGIKSCRGGEFWLPVGDQTAEFGFARDGQWHSLKIPLNRFANTDFRTLSQMFMISSVVNPTASMNLSIDNVWYEPSTARTTPQNGDFGVYTETASHATAGSFALGVQGDFFIWAKTMNATTQHPYDGAEDISLISAGLGWTGLAFTPNAKYNLTAFRYPGCQLQFAMKTTTSTPFLLGMKSGNIDGVGQKWINFGGSGSDPYGFVRDGQWHVVSIPMSDFAPEVDLSAVSQFFEILSTAAISSIELDDVHFTNGGAASPPN